jgi:hypothetical protein
MPTLRHDKGEPGFAFAWWVTILASARSRKGQGQAGQVVGANGLEPLTYSV